jgi:HK97 family phage major capsid protein
MPYEKKKENDKFCVYKEGESKAMICYSSESKADDYIAALYAAENKSVKELSLREMARKIEGMIYDAVIPKNMSNAPSNIWIEEMFDDYVVINDNGKYFKMDYKLTDNGIELGEKVEAKKEVEWEPVKSVKIGASISKDNKGKLSKIREYQAEIAKIIDELDPMEDETKSIPDTMITYGQAVKATQLENGDVKLGGYLVTFADANDTDLEGDFFTKNTDFGLADKSSGWFHHCMPLAYNGKSLKYTSPLPDVKLTKDDLGVFAEIVIGSRNKYEKLIADLGMAGKLAWSSGTAPNLVTTKSHKNGANEITRWPLGLDASLTPTPAEPKNGVIPLKSISVNLAELIDQSEAAETVTNDEPAPVIKSIKEFDMTPEEIQAMKDEINEGVKATVIEAMKAAPAPDSTGTQPDVQVTLAEGDKPFLSLAEQCKAVKMAVTTNGRTVDQRLLGINEKYYKASGNNEAIPAEGGYLLQPSISTEIIAPMRTSGAFTPYVRKLPVSANSNSGWLNGVDETSRVAGSRWGGVLGYRVAEAATLTASKPKFRRINWELKKYAVLMYGSDELLADSTQFEAVARQSAGEELNFMINDDIMNGIGVGGAQGILKSPALIYVARDTASKVLHVDLVTMWQRLHPQFRANAKWFINSEVEAQFDQLYFTGTTSVLSPYVTYTPEGVMRIKGKDVVVTEFNPALNSAGDVVLADPTQYLMWEKSGVDAASSIHVSFLTDETAFRFIYLADGQGAYSSALTPYKGTTTQSPFVTLGAATTAAA